MRVSWVGWSGTRRIGLQMCFHCEVKPASQIKQWPTRRTVLLKGGLAAAFAITTWLFEPNIAGVAIGWLYAAFLLTVLVIDFEHRPRAQHHGGTGGRGRASVKPAAADAVATELHWLEESSGLGLFMLVYLTVTRTPGNGGCQAGGTDWANAWLSGRDQCVGGGDSLGRSGSRFFCWPQGTLPGSRPWRMHPTSSLGALFAMWWYW